jgi:hypothetical protein
MVHFHDDMPPLLYVHFDKGDLIMKEGDYGLSIYKILVGQVQIFKHLGDTEITLATLGPGEVFGEMTFLKKLLEPRSASARAVEDLELEVWHPARLSKEYEQMPPIIKYIINQNLNRLNRMDKIVVQLTEKKEKVVKGPKKEPGDSRRRHYRKQFELGCTYRPVGSSARAKLAGQIKDISRGGLGMEVKARNASVFPHNPDAEFEINVRLPSGQDIDVVGRIRSVKTASVLGQLRLGLEFVELKGGAMRHLGFFLMT